MKYRFERIRTRTLKRLGKGACFELEGGLFRVIGRIWDGGDNDPVEVEAMEFDAATGNFHKKDIGCAATFAGHTEVYSVRSVPALESFDLQPVPSPVGIQPPAPSNEFVQPVAEHCDRILWQGRYYSLPLDSAQRIPVSVGMIVDAIIEDAARTCARMNNNHIELMRKELGNVLNPDEIESWVVAYGAELRSQKRGVREAAFSRIHDMIRDVVINGETKNDTDQHSFGG